MNATYLTIDNNLAVHERESRFWLAHNISSIRVSSMNEGIACAVQKEFYYIGINAANIDYEGKLPILRDVTNAPIFIAVDSYDREKHTKAMSLGADLFGEISNGPKENYDAVMAALNRINSRACQPKPDRTFLLINNILISQKRREVFAGNKEIELTKLEFDLLYYLMSNPDRVFTCRQLYRHVWSDEDVSSIGPAIKNTVARIRKKIDNPDVIENVYGVGYKFPQG
jgi:DNA-binding response OmpR family regulator